ncbi:acyl-CoA dehydrogenase family protein [Rhodococcus oxybenzonivorans]|uniref:acyl-CoA dehydrogenase family protein n=1 Tax=Rhodococcus oxybenzonivorans TaxID=1990687 RepID=UPI0029541170|nr:acyl-CoA dehydrogenase family protein [Rhodococcus oxybenzonivorans]MDV7352733.1 acyl-CoA dehydrogenase family protein [Rhodococcus oxybenzonivorans]
MDLLPSEEQLEIVSAASDFMSSRMPIEDIRRRIDEPISVDLGIWREGAELGLTTLGLPEEHGGSGRGIDDEVLLFANLGQHLATGPFLATTLAARIAAHCGDTDLVTRIADGQAHVGLAELRDGGAVGPDGFKGTFDLIDAPGAGHLLLIGDDGAAVVEATEFAGVETLESIDPGTRLATATVTAGRILHWVPATVDPIRNRALLLAAAGLAGIAQAAADMATQHAKTRVQFGRPIGVHQAVKHACTDMAVRADAARSQVYFAAAALQAGRRDSDFQVLAARIVSSRAAIDNCAANIQIQGGMGYTYEHNAHLFLKRAHVLAHLVEEPTDVLAELLEQGAPQ